MSPGLSPGQARMSPQLGHGTAVIWMQLRASERRQRGAPPAQAAGKGSTASPKTLAPKPMEGGIRKKQRDGRGCTPIPTPQNDATSAALAL